MLTQLQIHYPKGSLVTELVAIDHGQYIVRCLVQNEGTILVTGMAAAHTVEVAEDQARSRALQALGINTTVTQQAQSSSEQGSISSTPMPVVSTTIAETPVLPITMPASMAKTQPQPEILTTSETSKMSVEANTPVAQKTTASQIIDELSFSEPLSYDSSELETAPEVESDWMTQKVSPPQDTPLGSYQDEVEPETTSAVSSTAAPIDFSDVIARTNVELKRLGWTNQQGRDYLVQTYGKRSRQLLTDEELLDFLKHLESEPLP
ncbi:MAG: hypothetical protein ABI417_11580 [Coleofasciculaceae cyanobacterium]